MIKGFLLKILFLVIVFNLPFISTTNSLLSDEEQVLSNNLQSSSLDLTLRSGQGNFVPTEKVDGMTPGDSVGRDIYVGKTPTSIDLNHDVSYEYLSGDVDLCQQLQLKVWYDHYHCDPTGGYACRDMRLKYNGFLTALLEIRDSDFTILHPDDLFDTNIGDGIDQWFYYSLSLPEGLDTSFTNKICQFNLKFKAWQVDSDGTWGYLDEESLESTISSGEWVTDETAPEALISAPLEFYYNDDFIIDFSASDVDGNISDVSLYYNFNGGDWQFLYTNTGYSSSLVDDSFTVNLGDLEGDGEYEFMTIATDDSGNIEADDDLDGALSSLELDFVFFEELTMIDMVDPLTVFSVDPLMAVAKDAVYNGGFENEDLEGWTIDSNGSDHQATIDDVHSGSHSALIGFRDDFPSTDGAYDSINQTISLPATPSSTLSFWYRLLTDDLSSGGFFDVFASPLSGVSQLVAHAGWDDPLVLDLDLGWQNVSYQLNGIEGQDVELEFKVSQPDKDYKAWAFIDDIRVCSVENYLEEGETFSLSSNDASGSDNSTIYYSIDGAPDEEYIGPVFLPLGEHAIDYYSEDEAGNAEDAKTIDVEVVSEVDFGVVLNEFLPNPSGLDGAAMPGGEWVKLYNNSENPIDVDGWVLYDSEDGHELIINTNNSDNNDNVTDSGETIVPAGGILTVYRNGDTGFVLNNTGGDEVRLYNGRIGLGGVLVDSFEYEVSIADDKSFKRDPDGIGTWKDPQLNPVLYVGHDEEDRSVSFTVLRLSEFEKLDYEITYQSDNGLDGVVGSVSLGDVNELSRDNILLGTCSSSICVLDEGVRMLDFRIVLFDEEKNEELELLKTLEISL